MSLAVKIPMSRPDWAWYVATWPWYPSHIRSVHFTLLITYQEYPASSHLHYLLTEWPSFPEDFSFGPKVRPGPNEICARIFERLDYFAWKNYLFCTPADKRQLELRWYDRVPLNRDMPCTLIYVPDDTHKKGLWDDNHLCLPRNSGFPYRLVS